MFTKDRGCVGWKRNLLAFLFGLGLLIVIEGGLRLLGLFSGTGDLYCGYYEYEPLFSLEEENGQRLFKTSHGAGISFNYQQFPETKGASTKRIFCFGGSSTYGFPLGGHRAFPYLLKGFLEALCPPFSFEVINCGGLAYGSHRERLILQETLSYQPDLLIVFSGHNEFVEGRHNGHFRLGTSQALLMRKELDKLRLYRLLRKGFLSLMTLWSRPQQAEPFNLDEVKWDEAEYSLTLEHYRYNLKEMVRRSKRAGVPIVLLTMPANHRDWPPAHSRHRESITPQELNDWQEHMKRGHDLLQEDRAEEAIEEFTRSLEIDPEHAMLHFLVARAYEETQRYEKAQTHYQLALDKDLAFRRAPSPFNQAIRQVAHEEGAPLVDIEEAFKKASPHGLIGNSFIHGPLHPNPQGHLLIAVEICKQLAQLNFFKPREEYRWEKAEHLYELPPLSPGEKALMAYNYGKWFEIEGSPEKALDQYQQALQLMPSFNPARHRMKLINKKTKGLIGKSKIQSSNVKANPKSK